MTFRTTSAGLAALALFGGLAACETPPVGWEGAGRLQTLPMQQPDGAAPGIDGGDDSGGDDSESPGPDPGAPTFDAGDAGDAGVTDAGGAG